MFDDRILVEENLEEVCNRLDELRLALKGMELRISRSKIEYIEYEFGQKRAITISGNVIQIVKQNLVC